MSKRHVLGWQTSLPYSSINYDEYFTPVPDLVSKLNLEKSQQTIFVFGGKKKVNTLP